MCHKARLSSECPCGLFSRNLAETTRSCTSVWYTQLHPQKWLYRSRIQKRWVTYVYSSWLQSAVLNITGRCCHWEPTCHYLPERRSGATCLCNFIVQEPPSPCQSVLKSCGESAASCPPGLAYCGGWGLQYRLAKQKQIFKGPSWTTIPTSWIAADCLWPHPQAWWIAGPYLCWSTVHCGYPSNILQWPFHTFSFSSIQTVVYFRFISSGNLELLPQNYRDRTWDTTSGNWLHLCLPIKSVSWTEIK